MRASNVVDARQEVRKITASPFHIFAVHMIVDPTDCTHVGRYTFHIFVSKPKHKIKVIRTILINIFNSLQLVN